MMHLDDHERRFKYLIRDRDSKFSFDFDAVLRSEDIRIIRTPVRAPNANAHAERWVGTIRRDCLDRLLILNRRTSTALSEPTLSITTSTGRIARCRSSHRRHAPRPLPIRTRRASTDASSLAGSSTNTRPPHDRPSAHDRLFEPHGVRTLREDCLDRLLIVGRRHPERVLRLYVPHYNEHRPHRALGLAPPDRLAPVSPARLPARVERRDLLGGLVHEYRAAA